MKPFHSRIIASKLGLLTMPVLLVASCGSDPAPPQPPGTTSQTTATSVATSGAALSTSQTAMVATSGGQGSTTTGQTPASSGATVTTAADAGTTGTTGSATSDTSATGAGAASATGVSLSATSSASPSASISTTAATGAGGGTGNATNNATTTAGGSDPTTVWIAGDSTVANGNTPCPAGWGKHLAPYFNDQVTINNAAVGGRSVRTWLYNVTNQMGDDGECVLQTDGSGEPTLQARWQGMLDGMQAGDTLMIQFGINDGSSTCDRHVGIEAFKESYGMMAEAAKARGAQPIFITPVSAIACDSTSARGTRGGYVDATIEAGMTYDVPVIDLHQLSVDLYNSLEFCPVPGGDVSAGTTGPVGDFFCDDHTHFSDSGAQDIAGLVAGALAELGVGLGQYLVP